MTAQPRENLSGLDLRAEAVLGLGLSQRGLLVAVARRQHRQRGRGLGLRRRRNQVGLEGLEVLVLGEAPARRQRRR